MNVRSHCFIGVKLVHDERVLADAAIFVAMSFPKSARMDVRHGFSAVDSAREMTVTAASDSRLISLDGQPAVEAYANELRRLQLAGPGPPNLQRMAKYSLGVTTPFGEGLVIRSPIKLLPNRELQMTSALATGNRVKLVTTTRERLLAAARWLKNRVLAGEQPINADSAIRMSIHVTRRVASQPRERRQASHASLQSCGGH